MNTRRRLLLDILMLGAFLAAGFPFATGIGVHEWLSLTLFAAALVHVLLNWDWVERVSDRLLERARTVSALDFAVDAVLFISFVTVSVSGLLISQVVLLIFGIQASSNEVWSTVHSVSAALTMASLGVHFALHWRWMSGVVKRIPAFNRNGAASCPERF